MMRRIGVGLALLAIGAGAWWLLREAPPGTPAEPAPPALATHLRFDEAAAACGLRFEHVAGRTDDKHLPETMGSGLAVCDFNRDGAPDVYVVSSGAIGAQGRSAEARDRLFLNDGKGSFRDVSEAWGVVGHGYGMGVAVGDVDNDGWNDLLLTSYGGGVRLYRNQGDRFADITAGSGLAQADLPWSSSASFLDVDLDGDLDLYVAQYVVYDPARVDPCYAMGVRIYCHPINFPPLPDRLFLNAGDGRFVEASERLRGGVDGRGLALVSGDIDSDGDVDMYVANDLSRNLLWLNDGRGGFDDQGQRTGVAYSLLGEEEAGMGSDLSDIDGDGDLDLACTNFQRQVTSIYQQENAGIFREVADAVGVGASSRRRLGFGIEFFDADNDGDEDLATANGHVESSVAEYTPGDSFEQQNTVFVNDGAGHFVDVSDGAGSLFAQRHVSRGLVSADLDGDGALDLVFSNNGGPLEVGLNRSTLAGDAVVLWLEGVGSNRSAIGSRVRATVGDRVLLREVRGASSYLSVSDLRVHIGLGAQQKAAIEVRWPGGELQPLGELGPGFFRVRQGGPAEPFEPGARVWPR